MNINKYPNIPVSIKSRRPQWIIEVAHIFMLNSFGVVFIHIFKIIISFFISMTMKHDIFQLHYTCCFQINSLAF